MTSICALKVSVIVVNYNGGDHFADCIRHLRCQTAAGFEAIIVDNGSEDGSLAHVPGDDARFRVLALGRNTGFAFANNRGVELARGPWVALLNNDAFPEPDWLEQLLEAARRQPDFAFFGSHQLLVEPVDHLDGTGDMLAFSGRAWRRDHGRPIAEGVQESGEVFGACAAAAMYDRAAFLEVGGFEESFFCYFEDVDLAFKLRLAGYRCLQVAAARVRHVGSATSGTTSEFAVYHGLRNQIWAYFKNMPWDLLILNLPRHCYALLRSLVALSLRGRHVAIRRAYWDAFCGLPRILRYHRPQTQRLRRVSSTWLARFLQPG